jgi:hypothetical protein
MTEIKENLRFLQVPPRNPTNTVGKLYINIYIRAQRKLPQRGVTSNWSIGPRGTKGQQGQHLKLQYQGFFGTVIIFFKYPFF